MRIDLAAVQKFLARRRPGQSALTSPRQEKDVVRCVSGLENDVTLGTPITLLVDNEDKNPSHYADMKDAFRPSHADYTTLAKYGVRAKSGGGRASARETIGRVAAAAIAEQFLGRALASFRCLAWVESVKDVACSPQDPLRLTRDDIDKSMIRCPDEKASLVMEEVIRTAKDTGDTVGGVIQCAILGLRPGLGSPVFDKFEASLARAMLSLPATKGFEVGSGFAGTRLFGSEHNDAFTFDQTSNRVATTTNRSGGIQGGITNGEPVLFRVAFKPVATIFKPQASVDEAGSPVTIQPKAGRHDPCVLPRAVPMVEAMASLVAMDHFLEQLLVSEGRRLPQT